MWAYGWLQMADKTPRELGLAWDDTDPWYRDAMLVINAGHNMAMQQDMKG